jgi:hypothetical protein
MDLRLLRTTRVACLWLGLSGHRQPAYAQSDGTYCVGPTYLAYERARPPAYDSLHGTIPPLHTLHILRVDASGAIATHLKINLPFFTVHGMQCLPANVRVLGWDSLYTIGFAGAAPYSVTADVAPWAGQGSSRPALAEYPDSTLWHGWNPAAVVTVLLPPIIIALPSESPDERLHSRRAATGSRPGLCSLAPPGHHAIHQCFTTRSFPESAASRPLSKSRLHPRAGRGGLSRYGRAPCDQDAAATLRRPTTGCSYGRSHRRGPCGPGRTADSRIRKLRAFRQQPNCEALGRNDTGVR